MTMRQMWILIGCLMLAVRVGAQNTEYKPIPPGFDFPAKADDLLTAVRNGDETKLREHAWTVFAGLTQPARPTDPQSEAIWETWYSGAEVFAPGPSPEGVRTLQRRFSVPRQFLHGPGLVPEAVGESEAAFTLFDRETYEHVRANQLQLRKTLKQINSGWTPQTPIADRKIKDFPSAAMSLKTVWMLVKKDGITPIPIWDPQPPVTTAPAQPPPSWRRVVAVDPSRDVIPDDEKKDVTFSGKTFPGSHVVSLKKFYQFQLSAG